MNSLDRHDLKLAPVLEVFTPCLIVVRNKLVRAIILEVKIDGLFIALVDYGIKETVPRTAVFEVPPKCDIVFYIIILYLITNKFIPYIFRCNLIEMRSLNVVLDRPKGIIIDENMFVQKYFHMLPVIMDPKFGLYKVKLFKKINADLTDIFNDTSINVNCLKLSKSPELFSITEIQVNIQFYNILFVA